jgi:hypothetical protein
LFLLLLLLLLLLIALHLVAVREAAAVGLPLLAVRGALGGGSLLPWLLG